MVDVKVVITSPSGVTDYVIRVESADIGDDERKIRNVLAAGVEMGCALLDAKFSRTDS